MYTWLKHTQFLVSSLYLELMNRLSIYIVTINNSAIVVINNK